MTTIAVPKITPFLWFNDNAHEAIQFYTSIFEHSNILRLHPVVSAFELEGQQFMAINGGPHFTFTEALSFFVSCDSQEEIDRYWEKLLSGGGKEQQCGWLKDKFGLSWQIVPSILGNLMNEPKKAEKVMKVLLTMTKLDIRALEKAANS
jgi:predicted 3-demethylubiquinone-9 3-methyltransferase (glyoxalase superfamily)